MKIAQFRQIKPIYKWAILLLAIGFLVQLWLWIQTKGVVGFKVGNDEGTYTFLAYEILGEINSMPNFDFRSPGWPLTIATLLGIFGVDNYWVIGLFHRLLLALFPMLFFLTLTNFRQKNLPILALLSMGALLLPINRNGAEFATTEVLYDFLQILAFYLISRWNPSPKQKSPWIIALVFAILLYRTTVRLQSALIYGGIIVVFAILEGIRPGNRGKLLGNAVLRVAPLIVFFIAVGIFNKVQTGTFGLPVLARSPTAFYLARSIDPENFEVPDSPEMNVLWQLIPEVPKDRMPLSYWPNHYVAVYRAETILGENRLDFQSTVITPATRDYLAANLFQYIKFGLRWTLHDAFPQAFSPRKETLSYLESMPLPSNHTELLLGKRVTSEVWQTFQTIIAGSSYQAIAGETEPASALYQKFMNPNLWPLHPGVSYDGLTGLIGMIGLLVLHRRKMGLALMIFYFGDIVPPAFVCGDCVSSIRFQYPLQSASMIAFLLLLVELANYFDGRRSVSIEQSPKQ